MNVTEVLAKRLAQLMRQRITLDTQLKVEAASGVGQSTIQRILKQEVSPRIDIVEKLAHAFGVTVTDLLSEDDETARVMSLYRRMVASDKARVLAFIEVAVGSSQQPGEDFARTTPVQSRQLASLQRASSAPPADDSQPWDKDAHTNKKRGARH